MGSDEQERAGGTDGDGKGHTIHQNTKLGNAKEGTAERTETKRRSKRKRWDRMVISVYKEYLRVWASVCKRKTHA